MRSNLWIHTLRLVGLTLVVSGCWSDEPLAAPAQAPPVEEGREKAPAAPAPEAESASQAVPDTAIAAAPAPEAESSSQAAPRAEAASTAEADREPDPAPKADPQPGSAGEAASDDDSPQALDAYVRAVEARVQALQRPRDERKEAAKRAARQEISRAQERIDAAEKRVRALDTAAGTPADRAKERALRRLEQLAGRLDRARSVL